MIFKDAVFVLRSTTQGVVFLRMNTVQTVCITLTSKAFVGFDADNANVESVFQVSYNEDYTAVINVIKTVSFFNTIHNNRICQTMKIINVQDIFQKL